MGHQLRFAMGETRFQLASTAKTVLVAGHVMGEVRQLA